MQTFTRLRNDLASGVSFCQWLLLLAVLLLAVLLGACTSVGEPTPAITPSPTPDPMHAATGGGDPRTAGYWSMWNSCAPDNRAETARANGGRAAGWFIMDDLIDDPGLQLGDLRVETCEQGLALLHSQTEAGEQTDDPIYELASALLAAELNLGVGSKSCPIVEEAVFGGHLVLLSANFSGSGKYAAIITDEVANAIPHLVELLTTYNRNELCR
jgi:hypothetical protein